MSLFVEPLSLQNSFTHLCLQLNLDQSGREKAWALYNEVQKQERLPAMADPLHWLVCSLYLVCSQTRVESVGGDVLKGSGVSLVQVNVVVVVV